MDDSSRGARNIDAANKSPSSQAQTIPALTQYAANGYNAKDGNFLGAPVFTLTYTNGNTVTWGSDGTRAIPDQVSASADTRFYSIKQTLLMETTSDYDRAYSASVRAEYSGISYSGSVGSSILYHGSLFTSTASTYALNYYMQSVLSFERLNLAGGALDSGFIQALNQLPTSISAAADQQKYIAFFEQYGTHYVKTARMGGSIIMETDIEDSVFETNTRLYVSTQISAGFSGMINSGSINAEAAYKTSKFLNEHRNEIQIQATVLGGLYDPGQDDKISDWQNSLYTSPVLLLSVPSQGGEPLTQFACISNLVTLAGAPDAIASNIQSMLSTYMTPCYVDDGLLTSPRNVTPALVRQSQAGDGFLLATLQSTQNGDCAWATGFDDDSDNPTTVRAYASLHFYTNRDHYVPSASFLMPTPHELTYMGTQTPTCGQPAFTLKHIGLGNTGEEAMGPWQPVSLNTPLTAAQDGFVVAYVDWNSSNGARGYVQGVQTLANVPTTVAGASQHVYSGSDLQVTSNSFTMPIRNGTAYQVNFTTTCPTPIANAYFVPLNSPLTLSSDFSARRPGLIYQAQSDGFLVAYLYQNIDGDSGHVKLYSHPDYNELTNLGLLAATSIHYYTGSDIQVPYNTATIPIQRGNYYTVTFTPTWGNPGLQLLWIPLTTS